jgi:hypothetical protein
MSSESSDVRLFITSRLPIAEVARHGAHPVGRSQASRGYVLSFATSEIIRDSNIHHLTV